MHEFFNELMRWRRVENIMLYRNIFIIELMKESKRGRVLCTRSEACLAEFLSDDLELVFELVYSLWRAGRKHLHLVILCPSRS